MLLSSLDLKMGATSLLPSFNSPESKASTGELLLITFAVVLSVLITILPPPRHRAQTRFSPTSPLWVHISMSIGISALVLSITSLFLGWLNTISLDALSGVIFALVPVVLSVPKDIFQFWYYSFDMSKYFDIDPMRSSFEYIRFGKKCQDDANCEKWSEVYLLPEGREACKGSECVATTYIREVSYTSPYLPNIFVSIAKWFKRRLRKSRPTTSSGYINAEEGNIDDTKETHQWHGLRVGHSEHCVVLRDVNKGLKGWWFIAVASATWLIAEPALARLSSRARMCHALQAVFDIISIGDVILERRRGYIWDQLKHGGDVRRACNGTLAFICNSLIEKLDLPWGQIKPSLADMTEANYPKGRLEENGLLLFVITRTSQLFAPYRLKRGPGSTPEYGDKAGLEEMMAFLKQSCKSPDQHSIQWVIQKNKREQSQEVIHKMRNARCGSEKEFIEKQTDWVDEWLSSWGSDPKKGPEIGLIDVIWQDICAGTLRFRLAKAFASRYSAVH